MIHHPLITEIASLPLEMLVRPVAEQKDDTTVVCLCPLCKSDASPHFVIYKDIRKRGGMYGTPVERWKCRKTGRTGYGAIELHAAITGRGAWRRENEHSPYTFLCEGEDLRHVLLELCEKAYGGTSRPKEEVMDEIRAKYPELLMRDYRTVAERPQEDVGVEIKTDFTPQDLAALGCSTWVDSHNNVCYGFDTPNKSSDWHFSPSQLHEDFKLYAVDRVSMPAVIRGGEAVSEVIHSTPWNPMFVCLVDDVPDSDEDYAEYRQAGAIIRPAMDIPPMVFSNSDEHTAAKIGRWLAGDKVFTRALGLRTPETTGVCRAIKDLDPDEADSLTTTRMRTIVGEDGKEKEEEEDIPAAEWKALSVIYCKSAQDAVASYYHLKALRHTYPKSKTNRWVHVAWSFGSGGFTSVHYKKLSRFAEKIYTFYPASIREEQEARRISCRHRNILRASLPETFGEKAHLAMSRIYCRPACSIRDFFLVYQMLPGEAYQYDGEINNFFSTRISSALSSMPLERKVKTNKQGEVKETYYVINPATIWEFMASAGYARDVREGTSDKIGRYVHIDGPFADELNAPSMVQATVNSLISYARLLSDSFPLGNDEYELMVQAIRRANKEVNEKTIASLPAVRLNYSDAYGREVDHFYYENGALRITPDSISLIPYDKIDFNVEQGEVMPWNVSMPKNLPFSIYENPEYRERKDRLATKYQMKDLLGRPSYTLSQLSQEENELALWAQTHRWIVDWKGKSEADLCPPLRVLRGFANEDWEQEQNLIHEGRSFSKEEQMSLDNRFANLLFCLGRALWRYRESKSNCVSYLLENEVTLENRAEGGSGKSTFVYIFAGCAGHVLNIDCRDLAQNRELAVNLADYRHRIHRIVHWEDTPPGFNLSKLYNFVTAGFSVRAMYHDRVSIPLAESPGHIVSSNYPITELSDSTMRRICMGGFSHRFAGQNIIKNKSARYISDIMPDFNATNPERLSPASRNQIIAICALAVQFVMRYDEKVDAQKQYVEQRILAQSLGDSFLRFARVFFAQEHVYGTPQDLDSMLEEYKSVYAEASKNKNDSFSPKAFKRRVLDYCETTNILMNPEQLFRRNNGSVLKKAAETNYFAHQAWCTRVYFSGPDWENDTTIAPKQIRELARTEHAVYFYRKGKEAIPADNDELMAQYRVFVTQPDPAPVLDDAGNPVILTEDEKLRWRNYLDGKQRLRMAPPSPPPTPGPEPPLPF